MYARPFMLFPHGERIVVEQAVSLLDLADTPGFLRQADSLPHEAVWEKDFFVMPDGDADPVQRILPGLVRLLRVEYRMPSLIAGRHAGRPYREGEGVVGRINTTLNLH